MNRLTWLRISGSVLWMKDNSSVQTLTTSGNGGNIFLSAKDYLLMRRGNSITASATATPT